MKLRAVSGIMLTLLLIGMLTLTFNIHPVKSEPMGEVLFFDDFSDELWTEQHWTVELGNFEVINGEYFTQTPIGEESYAAVNNLNFIDGIIEVKLRFTDAVGFQAWIFFRHTGIFQTHTPDIQLHRYSFYVSAEYDWVAFGNGTWGKPLGGLNYPIDLNVDYTLRVEVSGYTFTGFVNEEEVLSVTDSNYLYTSGRVGLAARRADVFFDNFAVRSLPSPPVGGKAIPINKAINKLELQTPWIWLSTIVLPLVATVVYVKLKKKKR